MGVINDGSEVGVSDIAEKFALLMEAQVVYEQACKEARVARNAETDALNRLNDAQKEFDAAVKNVRDDCKFGDWDYRKTIAIGKPFGAKT